MFCDYFDFGCLIRANLLILMGLIQVLILMGFSDFSMCVNDSRLNPIRGSYPLYTRFDRFFRVLSGLIWGFLLHMDVTGLGSANLKLGFLRNKLGMQVFIFRV